LAINLFLSKSILLGNIIEHHRVTLAPNNTAIHSNESSILIYEILEENLMKLGKWTKQLVSAEMSLANF